MRVAIIGGGAAGFFAALTAKAQHPEATVTIYEKSPKLLAKVKISGGGRCNVTNGEDAIRELVKAYPRGDKLLKRQFRTFRTTDTVKWFETRGVPLMTQEDNCVFPVAQDSQVIINCFLREAQQLGVDIKTRHGVETIHQLDGQLELHFLRSVSPPRRFDKVIVATGGSPKRSGLEWLAALGHEIVDPAPSLFTFNMPTESITELMGIVVEQTLTSIQGTRLKGDGPLLITHWGMSGPAILKLSAFGARILHDRGYRFNVQVNWVSIVNQDEVRTDLSRLAAVHAPKLLANYRPYGLPDRLWQFLLERAELPRDKRWQELGKKGLHKLTTILTNDSYQVQGKTTFKEEFVTCGGVSLRSINPHTMESKVCPNLYFAGEVLDIDGITGGYNFQSCWTTGYIAGQLA
jgi:predicted Rossmann fold flavoprotein